MNKKFGFTIIIFLVLSYGMFITMELIDNNINLISKTSPIGALISVVISVILTMIVNKQNKEDQERKIREEVGRETTKLRNDLWINRYRDERKVLKNMLEIISNLSSTSTSLMSSFEKNQMDEWTEIEMNFGSLFNQLIKEGADMITPQRILGSSLKRCQSEFEKIRSRYNLENDKNQYKWFVTYCKNEYFYNKKIDDFNDAGQLIHLLTRTIVTYDESARNIQLRQDGLKLDRAGKTKQQQNLNQYRDDIFAIIGVLLMLKAVVTSRISKMRQLEELRRN
ncbi:hypothetical protein H9L19_06370 [Weissella diestrammenae]|uniref:Uncharacterized protein n=1 Tax=Weissella diestrammenae TaxID=1162633 RepID=A0A7G9T4I2_9LACO|nr:hypothetical protein [Weissella diestrammenae]MCM0582141.1 hypothetical protein [Weissella diestrammenae]QNN75007.1 hypothetical protein H9L19_06370 [Weissella diestrammenae]